MSQTGCLRVGAIWQGETVEVARKVVGTVWPRLCEEGTESSGGGNVLQVQVGTHCECREVDASK